MRLTNITYAVKGLKSGVIVYHDYHLSQVIAIFKATHNDTIISITQIIK